MPEYSNDLIEVESSPQKQFKGLPTFIAAKVSTKFNINQIATALIKIPNVENVFEVTGEYDIIVIARTRTSSDLTVVIKSIRSLPGVMDTNSYLVLNEYQKEKAKEQPH